MDLGGIIFLEKKNDVIKGEPAPLQRFFGGNDILFFVHGIVVWQKKI